MTGPSVIPKTRASSGAPLAPSLPALKGDTAIARGQRAIPRMEALVDTGTLHLVGRPDERPGCAVLAGTGRIGGRSVQVFATEPSRSGGALGVQECARIVETIDRAVRLRTPVVGLWHSGGAKLQEDPASLQAVGAVFASMVRASGDVLQLSVVLGPAAGGAAYGPALSDIVIMGPAARVFVTGPGVVRAATGEQVDAESLGGPNVHGGQSGVAHAVTPSDEEAVALGRRLVTVLAPPAHDGEALRPAEQLWDDPGILDCMPSSPRLAYDVHPLLLRLLDAHPSVPFIELQASWAPNVVTGFGRLAGRCLGVVANNPMHLGGCLDGLSGDKAARFVRLCDAFGIPLLVVVDVPGYLPGSEQEWSGVVRRGAKLLHAFAESRVPRVTVITRKAYGGACIAMNSRALGATAVFAWPDAQVGVMQSEAAVSVLHRDMLADTPPAQRRELVASLASAYDAQAHGLTGAVACGLVSQVIPPSRTRSEVASALASAPAGRGRHGNIPL